MRRFSLSGTWSGAYRYPGNAAPETVFEAELLETEGGAFSGATREPNVLRLAPASVVTATVEGTRSGAQVSFVKFMDGNGGMHHTIRYEGVANAGLTRVEGEWRIRGDWSGSFFMERSDAGEEESVERKAEAEL